LKFGIKCENQAPKPLSGYVGVDVGIKDLAIVYCSDGESFKIKNVNKQSRVKRLDKGLKHAQRKLARAKKGSNNRKKALVVVQEKYRRLNNIRKDYTHKASAKIVNLKPQAIGIESLNVSGMMKNRHQARAIQEQNLSALLFQIQYKAERQGATIVKADRWYPSSKTCSRCGHIKRDLKLSDRIYKCPVCGAEIDRDVNAAINLMRLAQAQ
jgi:putative transposase